MAQKLKQDINIGPKLRELRIAAGWTQEQLIAKMQLFGCSTTRAIYSHIEIGDYNIQISELICLKLIYGIDYNEFFETLEQQALLSK